jgi:glutathione S-transferase
MLTVHHLNNSRSQRILWMLEELDLPYEIKFYQRDAKTMLAPPELKAVHLLGKSPVITDGDLVLAETGAIIETICEDYAGGRLRPAAGTAERRRWTYWLYYAEGSAMSPLLMKLVFSGLGTRAAWPLKGLVSAIGTKAQASFIDPQLKTHYDYWETELGKSAWFAGADFTAADVMMSFPLEAAASRSPNVLVGRPHVAAFLKTIHARPAYQRALERGGPYAFA